MTRPRKPLGKLRKIIAQWPETNERISHGSPTFWGGKKTFASFHDNHHGDGRVAVWIKSDADSQEGLVEANDQAFFIPPYVGPNGWIGMRLDCEVDWGLAEGLFLEGYRSVAPKRALKTLDD